MNDPMAVIEQAEVESQSVREVALQVVREFIDAVGEAYTFADAVEAVADIDGVDPDLASRVVAHLASDDVDPVTHAVADGERYVFVADFEPGDWWYGYVEYDDVAGAGRKVVCRQCVAEGNHPRDVGKVFGPDVTAEFSGYEDMADWLFERHFQRRHPGVDPAGVGDHIGASLATGTTIASNTAWHDGNVTGGTMIDVGSTSVSHADTSSQGNVDNGGTMAIQDVTLDSRGHVTGLTSADVGGSSTSLAQESGSFNVASQANTTQGVTFTNTYTRGILEAFINASADGGTDPVLEAGNTGFSTDGSGNIDGASIRVINTTTAQEPCQWWMFGETA